MIAVWKHELRSYFNSMTVYLFCAFILVFVGVGAMLYNIQSAVANFEYVLEFVSIGMTVIVPVLTMRVFAEEKKQKTDQLLYSLPLKSSQIVLGKYFALLLILLIPLVIVAVYPLVFASYGDVYLPTSYGSMLAFFFMNAALIAVGTFISSLTENLGAAIGISIPVLLLNFYCVKLANYVSSTALGTMITLIVFALLFALLIRYLTKSDNLAFIVAIVCIAAIGAIFFFNSEGMEDLLPDIMSKISLFERFYGFVDGVFDITSIIFYVSVVVFFLFITVQSLEKRRYN